jgi:NAD(P)-dependent dehydrogenase (short-subunit alcohol dehydrogenase family)
MAALTNRVAIVTGGGDGIGRAIVRRFAAEGARVLVAEIDEAAGNLVADEFKPNSTPTCGSCAPTSPAPTTTSR